MRRLINFVVLLLVLGAGFVAVTQPQNLPFRVPWQTQTPAPTPDEPQPDSSVSDDSGPNSVGPHDTLQTGPLGEITDAAITALVARQPVSIQALRAREYPGSKLSVVRSLNPGSNYSRQVVSY